MLPPNRNQQLTCSKPHATVWKAAKATVKEYYDVLSLNDQEQAGSFTTGSVFSGVRALSFSLSGTENTCTLSVTGHFSGITHHDKGDFFYRIEQSLKAVSTDPLRDEEPRPK